MSTDAARAYEQHFAECAICYARGNEKGWCAEGFKLWLAAREAERGYLLPATRKWLCSCGREIPGPGRCDRCLDGERREREASEYLLFGVRNFAQGVTQQVQRPKRSSGNQED